MVGKACLPSNAYYPRTPDYTLYSWVHVRWSEHSDSSFIYGFMSLDYGLDTMITTTIFKDQEDVNGSQPSNITFTTLWAKSAYNKLIIFLLFSPENRISYLMQIVISEDNLLKM